MAEQRCVVNPAEYRQASDSDTLVVGQGVVLVEQASSLATPASGYAVMYCKTDGHLYFKNDVGTETQLT